METGKDSARNNRSNWRMSRRVAMRTADIQFEALVSHRVLREQRALFQGRRLVMCWPTERHHRPSRRCNHGPYQFGALPLQLRREPHASRHVDEKSIRRGRPPKDHTAEERLAAERQCKDAWVRARRHAEGDGREPAGAATPPEGMAEGQQRSPQVTWLVMGATARR
jgi:hypothetical protein